MSAAAPGAPAFGGAASAPRRRSGVSAALAGAVRAVPAAAWACAIVALANGLAWSLIVPPFQVPDENAHYAYVQQVAERGTLPHEVQPEGPVSPREDAVLASLLTFGITGHRGNPAPFTQLQQDVIDAEVRKNLSARGDGDALTATGNPPVYYVLQAVPYKLTPSGKVLDKLAVMRWLSALMGAATVLLVFMFLRELLPGTRWAWTTGALMVAFQPLFGFISGGVNNDNLLYTMAAGVLFGIARAFRRGLTPRRGLVIGAFLGVGLVTKLTLIAFVPATAVALVLLVWRAPSRSRGEPGSAADEAPSPESADLPARDVARRGAFVAAAVALAPVALYLLLNHFVWNRVAVPGGVGGVASGTTGHTFSLREEISHVWQLWLPRLWMRPQFTYSPLWETWFRGFVGRFGWLDYDFPGWVYQVARVITLTVVAFAFAELVRRRDALRRRAGELAVYVLAVAGLCAEIGIQSYRELVSTGGVFEQPRYVLSLLPLYAALVALATRVGGRRLGPAIGAALVVLAIGHDLYAQAITIARYYA